MGHMMLKLLQQRYVSSCIVSEQRLVARFNSAMQVTAPETRAARNASLHVSYAMQLHVQAANRIEGMQVS